MSAWSKSRKLLLFAAGSFTGAASFYVWNNRKDIEVMQSRQVFNSWTTNFTPSACGKWDENWDHRDPKSIVKPLKEGSDAEAQNAFNEKLEKVKPTKTRHIIMIRHGQYYLHGKTDDECVLTQMGRDQAKFTGERLKALALPFDQMVQSTMTRAIETASIIDECLDHKIKFVSCPLLEEGAPIPPEPPVGHWRPEPSFFKDGARIEAAFRKYFHRASADQKFDSYTLLVCHANVIRYFVCRALQFPPEAWLRLSLNHASITWMSITPSGRVSLRVFGDAGHMPPAYVSTANINAAKPK